MYNILIYSTKSRDATSLIYSKEQWTILPTEREEERLSTLNM